MLTCCILTRNNAPDIAETIASAACADSVMVIDDGSTDDTVAVARNCGARVLRRPLGNDFASQRNAAMNAAPDGWVMFLDSDERIPPALCREITSKVGRESGITAYSVCRSDTFEGKKLSWGETPHVRLVRIMKKGTGTWVRPVHEVWEGTGTVGTLAVPLEHTPHSTVSSFLDDINRYTDADAREFFRTGRRVSWWQPVAYPVGKFFLNYVVRRGYRDGMPGLIHAGMMAFHSFLTRGKIWELQRSKA